MYVTRLDEGLLTPEDSRRIRARCVILRPGESVGAHSTQDMEEVILVLHGEIVAFVEEENRVVQPGEALFIPPHTEHNILNDSDHEAKYVYVRSR